MTDKILFNIDADGIGVLTFNRPEARNALDIEAMTAFAAAIRAIDDDVRVLILTGAGTQAFCSGADLIEMSGKPTEADADEMITLMGDALLALERLPIPVVAAINGYALGGGAEVTLACDLRIIDSAGKLGFVQAKRGVIPGWGGGQRLLRLVGYTRALDLLLRAPILSPEELLALKLVSSIAPVGGALDAARAWAAQVARLDSAVVRSMKALLQAGLTQPYTDALATERALFPPLWVGEARINSTREFLERRGS
jgi:enoyl-CoA hydratase/carnithine racemase